MFALKLSIVSDLKKPTDIFPLFNYMNVGVKPFARIDGTPTD